MTHEKKVEFLDQLEDSLIRAERGKKDLDLLIALRVLYSMMLDDVKKDDREARNAAGKM